MALVVDALSIPDVKLIAVPKIRDSRGFFSETYNRKVYEEAGLCFDFVQDNESFSYLRGTIRGLHFQTEPFAQAKLVRVARGRIWDVAVDIRTSSSTFGTWVGAEISAEAGNQIFIPPGFAHGFCTLEPDTEVNYKVSNFYSQAHEVGIRWNDPTLNIEWPLKGSAATLSEKDSGAPSLEDVFGKRREAVS